LTGIVRTIRKYGHDSMALHQVAEQKSKENDPKTTALDGMDSNEFDGEFDAVDDTAELYRLTGKPVECDVLVSAVPVCAPYQTLSQYTFRVKLTPGNLKRGKAARQCLEIFTKGKHGSQDQTKRQIDLIARITDSDWVNTLSGDVKIAAPGAAKIVKKNKTQKKHTEK
jgi:NFACT protein C-terminal domain